MLCRPCAARQLVRDVDESRSLPPVTQIPFCESCGTAIWISHVHADRVTLLAWIRDGIESETLSEAQLTSIRSTYGWELKECEGCHTLATSRAVCNMCESSYCETCYTEMHCGHTVCSGCAVECNDCNQPLCPECSRHCSMCGDDEHYCSGHLLTADCNCCSNLCSSHTYHCVQCGNDVCEEHSSNCESCNESVCDGCQRYCSDDNCYCPGCHDERDCDCNSSRATRRRSSSNRSPTREGAPYDFESDVEEG